MGTDHNLTMRGGSIDSRQHNSKSNLSCAECRRSKVRCDRIFPCSSCVRRGCADLCPDGSLPATKGNKALIAYSQELSEQVRELTQKVQALENELSATKDLHQNKRGMPQRQETIWDPNLEQVSRALGSMSINLKGSVRYRGETTCMEYLQEFLTPAEAANYPPDIGFPDTLADLLALFPLGDKSAPPERLLEFRPYLPPLARAKHLVDLYYTNVSWMGETITRSDFMKRVFDPIYQSLEVGALEPVDPHSLSLFFVLIATGTLHDDHPFASSLATQYFNISKAALCLEPIRISASCTTVQAVFLIFLFSYVVDRSANEERWLLIGLCCRLAQRIGLQRDCGAWETDPEEIQQRRMTFWALFTFDQLTSLLNGRPPAFDIRQVDCRFPDDVDKVQDSNGNEEIGWNTWAWRYAASCLAPAMQFAFRIRSMTYDGVLAIDKRIRECPLPSYLMVARSINNREWSKDPKQAMSQFCALCEMESVLLYIHRSYFAQAINQEHPMKHEYAYSVLAVHKGATAIVTSCRELYEKHPKILSHFWQFWSTIFSAGVMLGAIVIESPGCILAENALSELTKLLPVYEEGSRSCRPPATYLTLQKLLTRATTCFTAFHAGVPIVKSRENTQIDELDVLEGRRSTVDERELSCSPPPLHHAPADNHRGTSAQRSIFDYYSQNFGYSPPPNGSSPIIPAAIHQELDAQAYVLGDLTNGQFTAPPTSLHTFGFHTPEMVDQFAFDYYGVQPGLNLDSHPANQVDVWQNLVRRLDI